MLYWVYHVKNINKIILIFGYNTIVSTYSFRFSFLVAMAGVCARGDFIVGGRYRLIRKIGSGSFGDIYLGISQSSGEVSLTFSFRWLFSSNILIQFLEPIVHLDIFDMKTTFVLSWIPSFIDVFSKLLLLHSEFIF